MPSNKIRMNFNTHPYETLSKNIVIDYAGARVAEFSPVERRQLLDPVELYVGNMDDGLARVKMDEVKRQIDRTCFVWIGGSDPRACTTTVSTAL